MTVYVDQRMQGRSHMAADTVKELHEFAVTIGVNRCWYHKHKDHPHYDVNRMERLRAIHAGAKAVPSREVLEAAKRSALLSP